ncbi:NAC domain containing protein 2 [Euphorbia peplus]|nr:NAC domain containing protein 2 [Euphorbia peplus]
MDEFPVGFRFVPTDEELISCYLFKKQNGEPLPSDVVKDSDLYSNKPWKLFDKSVKQDFYVFAKLEKNGAMTKRAAGSGTWLNQNKNNVFDRDGRVIGMKKMFHYHIQESAHTNYNGTWIMHEFLILDSDDLVLCRIRNSDHEKESVDHNNLPNKATNPTKKTTRANPIKVANKNRPRKMTRDPLIIIANVVNVLPQDGDDHIHSYPTSSYGHMTQFGSIQDNNISFTGIEPQLMDVVANNGGKLDDHVEYNQQIINANLVFFQPQGHNSMNHIQDWNTETFPTLMDVSANNEGKLYDLVEYNEQETQYVLQEYQNFTDMIGLAGNHHCPMKRTRDSVIINANPAFYPQGDNTLNHIPSNSSSVNAINMIEFEPIQDKDLCPPYTEIEPPLMNFPAANDGKQENDGLNLHSLVQESLNLCSTKVGPSEVVNPAREQPVPFTDTAANQEERSYNVEYDVGELAPAQGYLDVADMIGFYEAPDPVPIEMEWLGYDFYDIDLDPSIIFR